jgi:pimeloyl-ACP methyl ester carboxylesterase
MDVTATAVTVNGVELAMLTAGHEGPLALCVHGFPDSAHTWRHLLPVLAQAGYRAVAPFLRGYAPSAVPTDGSCSNGAMVADALALHDLFGGDTEAVIIGHDWGATVACGAAVSAPDRWSKVITLAVPPGPAMAMALMGDLEQMKRSWYMFLFQHPLADVVVPANDLAFIDALWRDWSPGYDAADDLVRVKPSLRDAANLTAALSTYRHALGTLPTDPALEALQAATTQYPTQPTLHLHGALDGCIGLLVAQQAQAMAPANVSFHTVDGVGHFLHLERPDEVHDLILDALTGGRP